MLHVPVEYAKALEEVLRKIGLPSLDLSENALRTKEGKRWVERVARSVSEISRGLTRDRDTFIAGRYLSDKDLHEAYLAYFTTTNLLKPWPTLRELAWSGFFRGRTQLRHLDIGTGTGAAIWSLATYLKHEHPGVLRLNSIATDLLKQNIETVRRFAENIGPKLNPLQLNISTDLWTLPSALPPAWEKFDVITMMNVLNEVSEDSDATIIQSIESLLAEGGAVIMIEPSAKEPSRRALRFRDRMVAEGYHVYSPCTKNGGCPALLEEDNWCHTAFDWERPAFIRAIDDVTGNLRLTLKSTYAVFLREDANLSDVLQGHRDFLSAGRVVSELFNEKGRARSYICNERGRREYLWNKRDKTGENREMLELKRYDLVQIQGVEVRATDVKVGQEARIHKLVGPDGCGYVDK